MKPFSGAPVFETNMAPHAVYNTLCTIENKATGPTPVLNPMEGKPSYKLHTTQMSVNYNTVGVL